MKDQEQNEEENMKEMMTSYDKILHGKKLALMKKYEGKVSYNFFFYFFFSKSKVAQMEIPRNFVERYAIASRLLRFGQHTDAHNIIDRP